MTAESERIYIIGGTGNIGTVVVKDLLKNGVAVTVYARSPSKAKDLFGDDPNLTIVEGDVNELKPFDVSIVGHTRLLLLVTDINNFTKIKVTIAQKAYAAGVKQIVDISAISAGFPWRSCLSSTIYYGAEQALLAIPNRGAYIALRPFHFMTNMISREAPTVKETSCIVDITDPEETQGWISTNDIGIAAANIFQDPIEKHGDDAVYEMVGDAVSRKDRAELLSKVLGRVITYKKITPEKLYSRNVTLLGFPHLVAYMFLDIPMFTDRVTPGLSILLGRPPQTLEQWLEENRASFI